MGVTVSRVTARSRRVSSSTPDTACASWRSISASASPLRGDAANAAAKSPPLPSRSACREDRGEGWREGAEGAQPGRLGEEQRPRDRELQLLLLPELLRLELLPLALLALQIVRERRYHHPCCMNKQYPNSTT